MNYITNDKGELVIAVGQEGSVARTMTKFPKLFARINSLWWQEAKIDEAYKACRDAGANESETSILIRCSRYFGGEE